MSWSSEQGTYLSGQEAIDTLDLVAIQMERKWGADRLRLLVDEELRTKFDRQRKLTNDAITGGELEDVIRETRRMATAWHALDAVASREPDNFLPPTVFECVLEDGSVAQIVKEGELVGLQAAWNAQAGRACAVYTLEEVGRILSGFPSLHGIKQAFPGAVVMKVRQSISDPWDNPI